MSKPLPSKERRVHARKRSSIGAAIDTYFTHLRNISRNGAFVHTFIGNEYCIGQELIVTFPFKFKEDLKLISQVAWVSKDGIGVKFIKILSKPTYPNFARPSVGISTPLSGVFRD